MKSSVIVKADKNGNVIVQSSNPEYGYIQLIQDRMNVTDKGWLETKTFSTILKGKICDLKKLRFKPKQELPGNIVVVESLTPFDKNNPNKDLKVSSNTGAIFHTTSGEPIYRNKFWDPSGSKVDVLVPYDVNSVLTKIEKPVVKKKVNQKPAIKKVIKVAKEQTTIDFFEPKKEHVEENNNEIDVQDINVSNNEESPEEEEHMGQMIDESFEEEEMTHEEFEEEEEEFEDDFVEDEEFQFDL
tara:strand:+ start:599 stop:1324 length:726 start_codon:yes stop_codon:yes gene_type:complete